jgi:exonuclease VII small subunit
MCIQAWYGAGSHWRAPHWLATLEPGLDTLERCRDTLEPGLDMLERCRDTLEPGLDMLERCRDTLEPSLDSLEPGWIRLSDAVTRLN